jgi:hypothetical protein
MLPRVTQLELALQTQNPGSLARTFAGFVGTFYCRSDFDSLAREVSELLRLQHPDQAGAFRLQLDRRLCERQHDPVRWEIDLPAGDRAA